MDVWETILSFWRKVTLFSGGLFAIIVSGSVYFGVWPASQIHPGRRGSSRWEGNSSNSRAKSLGAEAKSWRPKTRPDLPPILVAFWEGKSYPMGNLGG